MLTRTADVMCTNPTTEKFSLRNASPLLLMGALVIALMITPILEQRFHSRAILYAGVTLVLVIGVFVNGRRQMLFIPSLVLALLTISVTWSTLIADYAALFVISCLLATLFYALIAGVMLILVLTRHLATVQSIFGAVCVYLLLGLGWAELYWAAARVDAAAFQFPPDAALVDRDTADGKEESVDGKESFPAFSEMIYFSFVTMLTLGYGDIHPRTPGARTLAWMQSVLGQFYLAVLVAWIVNSIRLWHTKPELDAAEDSS